jgi:hypothetical protein
MSVGGEGQRIRSSEFQPDQTQTLRFLLMFWLAIVAESVQDEWSHSSKKCSKL